MGEPKASTRTLVGQRFGMLTAMALVPHKGRTEMLCRCDCGIEKVICIRRLVPHSRSCGCTNRASMFLVGTVQGSWTIEAYEQDASGRYGFRCRCTCGVESFIEGAALRSGRSTMCRTCSAIQRARPNTQSNNVWHLYRLRAKKQGLSFDLTQERFRDIITRDCHYCGSPPQSVEKPNTSYGQDFLHNGIDRQDSARGYIEGNCVPCCGTCNYMKRTQTPGSFTAWAARVAAGSSVVQDFPLTERQAKAILQRYRSRAKQVGLTFTLDEAHARSLLGRSCSYCGVTPSNNQAVSYYQGKRVEPERFSFNGIDRIDPTESYVDGNCRTACWDCNNAKGTHTLETFLAHVRRIVAYQTGLISSR